MTVHQRWYEGEKYKQMEVICIRKVKISEVFKTK